MRSKIMAHFSPTTFDIVIDMRSLTMWKTHLVFLHNFSEQSFRYFRTPKDKWETSAVILSLRGMAHSRLQFNCHVANSLYAKFTVIAFNQCRLNVRAYRAIVRGPELVRAPTDKVSMEIVLH